MMEWIRLEMFVWKVRLAPLLWILPFALLAALVAGWLWLHPSLSDFTDAFSSLCPDAAHHEDSALPVMVPPPLPRLARPAAVARAVLAAPARTPAKKLLPATKPAHTIAMKPKAPRKARAAASRRHKSSRKLTVARSSRPTPVTASR